MVRRTVDAGNNEPNETVREIPSEKEHLFEVIDILPDKKDSNFVVAICEVVSGDEAGRSIMCRLSVDSNFKGFFFTKLFLKCISEPYKGLIDIDEDRWIGKQFFATVAHNKSKDGTKIYANINTFNLDKILEQKSVEVSQKKNIDPKEIAWDE